MIKLTNYERYIICKRIQDKKRTSKIWPLPGFTRGLVEEFGMSERQIQRIGQMNLDELRSKAGVVEEIEGRVRVRVQALMEPLLTDGDKKEDSASLIKRDLAVSDQEPRPIVPIGSEITPVKLTRKFGTAYHISAEGTTIVLDGDRTAVQVLNCPMYDRRWNMIRRHNVNIISIEPKKVRGEVIGAGETQRWSGEKIQGTLVFYGIRGNDIAQVSRVEFHPEVFPEEYVKEHMRIRRVVKEKMAAIAALNS